MKTEYILTELSGESEIIGVVFIRPIFDHTVNAMIQAISAHFDVDEDQVKIENVNILSKGIPVWESENFEVSLGDDIDDVVVKVSHVYVY